MSHRSSVVGSLPLLAVALFLMVAAPKAQFFQGGRGAGQDQAVVASFDVDKDGRLNAAERQTAREALTSRGGRLGGGRGRGGPGRATASPGIKLAPADVQQYPDAPLYDPAVLRTFFIEFENPDWEAELVAFNNTDVDVPARVAVDGRVYQDVGVHFRGNSSFAVGDGYKRSLNLSFDFVHEKQAIGGYRTLNFLNANADPTLMRTVLSMHIARQYIPAPKANFVRVVINGENWGVYANAQQFNKEFVNDNFKTTKGARWKIPQGGGGGGFTYMGDDADRYKRVFQIKSKDEPESWAALIDLAKTLEDTPAEKLEAALASRLDVDGYLRFLALDNVLASADAFYSRGSDYSLYRHPDGRFHFVFHDANETFSSGGRGGFGGGGTQLSPLVGVDDIGKPIISKVLAVPALRARYLAFVREIAEKSLDWNALRPVVRGYRDLIEADVARDTRKLFTTEEFLRTTADDPADGTLRSFIEARRTFLLAWFAENTARTVSPGP
ncbi:MAG TPA: CotH kinase family protein [Vicinamibacterales bacterium]|nr:CotH kinase family protein [Vicinamibacterales bacterium]